MSQKPHVVGEWQITKYDTQNHNERTALRKKTSKVRGHHYLYLFRSYMLLLHCIDITGLSENLFRTIYRTDMYLVCVNKEFSIAKLLGINHENRTKSTDFLRPLHADSPCTGWCDSWLYISSAVPSFYLLSHITRRRYDSTATVPLMLLS